MVVYRLLILVLICSVTLREDLSFFVTSIFHLSQPVLSGQPDIDELPGDEDLVTVAPEHEWNYPDGDELPYDDGEIPINLGLELYSSDSDQTEEMLLSRDNNLDLGSAAQCFFHENDLSLPVCIESFYTLKKLRI